MMTYNLGPEAGFAEGDRRVVKCGEHEIAVFKVRDRLHGWHNRCAHQGGPVCQGRIMQRVLEPVNAQGRTRSQQYASDETHIICPWHGYEYNIETGAHPGNPKIHLRRVDVEVSNGDVCVRL